MADMQVPVTKLPRLDGLARTRAEAGRAVDYRTLDAAVELPRPDESFTSPDHHRPLLRRYAAFLAAFTGDDDVAFDFALVPRRDARPALGVARGVAPASAPSDVAVAVVAAVVEASESDFGLVVAGSAQAAAPWTSRGLGGKPFVVVVEPRGCVVRLAAGRVPSCLADSIASTLLSRLGLAAETRSLSVLNHPPAAEPPDFESLVGLRAGGREGARLLHAAFCARARDYPQRAAIDFLGRAGRAVYSYEHVDGLSSALARRLRASLAARGCHDARRVAALLAQSPEHYVAWLAVLKAGCAFCPIPVETPAELLADLTAELEARVVLTSGRGPSGLAAVLERSPGLEAIDVEAFMSEQHTAGSDGDAVDVDPADVAYIMYTSGSTGRPKGVQVTHLNAACAVAANVATHPAGFRGPLRWFQFAAPTFDISVAEIFMTWSVGGTLCACDRALALTDPEAAIAELAAGSILTTPSMASLLRPDRVPGLRHVWSAGEALTARVIESFAAPDDGPSDRVLVNAYGPTETTINCTACRVADRQRGSVLGPALSTCSVVILDAASPEPQPVPLGFPGELAVGGPQVSAGYLKRPEQNAQSFVDVAPYGRLYRTGDRARIVEGVDGALAVDFLGRMAWGQVKMMGRRVELGEIEAAMAGPAVAEAAVVYMAAGRGGLVDAVVAARGVSEPRQVLADCQSGAARLLQPFMRPRNIYLVERLPRTGSDKVDRNALQRMCQSPAEHGLRLLGSGTGTAESEPAPSEIAGADLTDMFERVAGAICETVAVAARDLRPSTTLLSLGLDSLRVVGLLQLARDRGLPALKFAEVLSCRSVEDLVRRFRLLELHPPQSVELQHRGHFQSMLQEFRQKHHGACAAALSADAGQIESLLPVTTSQAITLASFVLSSNTAQDGRMNAAKAYVQHSILEVSPEFDVERLVRAWCSVLGRLDMMRTVFFQVDEELTPFAQCILSKDSPEAQIKARSYQLQGDDCFDAIASKACQDAEDMITLDKPPRSLAVVLSPNRNAIIFSMIHSIFDGASWRMLLYDVEREYFGEPALERDGVLAAVEKHFSQDRQGAASFWESHLRDSTRPRFPCLRSTLPGPEEPMCCISSFKSELTTEALGLGAARMQSTPLSVLQSAWAAILLAYTGQRDIVFGNVISDRFTPETDNCAAPTLAVHPVRVVLDGQGGRTNSDVAEARTEGNAEALNYLHTPLSSASYDTAFAWQHFAGSSGEDRLYLDVSTPAMDNDQAVMIEVYEKAGKLEFTATYQTCLVDEAAAQMMLSDLASITEAILEKPQAPFVDTLFLPAVRDAEAASRTVREDGAIFLHQDLERWAREKPEELALTFHHDLDTAQPPLELTYRQLDQAARHVARVLRPRLRSLPKPHVVPICMQKCPELYVAILGVLKAGAAWCPIDPQYPPARKRYLLGKTTGGMVLVARDANRGGALVLPPGVEAVEVACRLDDEAEKAQEKPDREERQELAVRVSEQDIAYVIFTSGTTGVPKGVPITHRAASSSIDSFVGAISQGFTGGQVRYLQFANFTFDVFIRDLFAAWKLGGTLVSATSDLLLGSFAALANKTAATHASMTPTFASTLRARDFETLRVVTMGGETLPQALADEWKTRVSLFNIYGPAETAINVTARRVTPAARSGNIGRPLPTVEAWVVRDGRPLLGGALGELVVAGPQLSPGYWTDDGAGEARFGWNDVLQRRVYRTGDMVRQLSDGTFDFVGRNDSLVKIRGMRVELAEIAAVCAQACPSIVGVEVLLALLPEATESSVVCFLDSGAGSKDAVSDEPRVLTIDAASRTRRAVALHAASQLPSHMVPDVFIVMSSFPRTPSAKVDRGRLLQAMRTDWPALWSSDAAASEQDAIVDPEWSKDHRKVLEAIDTFAKIRGRSLRPDTTAAELGLDSIAAIKLSSRLKADGHAVSAVSILACRSIGDIVALTTGSHGQVGIAWREAADRFDRDWRQMAAQVVAEKTEKLRLAPTTPMQDGVLVESLREPLSYWGSFVWTLSASVDHGRLREAWKRLTKTHEILRVGFLPLASLDGPVPETAARKPTGTFTQVIYDETAVPWVEIAATDALPEAVRRVNDQVAAKHHSAGFSNPPWQTTLLTVGETRAMVLTMHHSLYDGDMIRCLVDDLELFYKNLGHQSERCQVYEAVGRLYTHQSSASSLHFWSEQLKGFEDETDADMEPRAALSRGPIVHRTVEMRTSLSKSRLSRVAAEFGALSFNSLIRVAYGAMLAELAESDRALFAEIRSERVLEARLTDAMAPLGAIYPVPVTMSGTPAQMVQAQAELAAKSVKHGPIHAGHVRRLLNRRADETLYPAVFVFHPFSADEASTELWQETGDEIHLSVDHGFALNVFETSDDGVRLSLAVDETLMTAAAQDMFVRQLDALLTGMALHPEAPSILHLTDEFPPALVSFTENVLPEELRSPARPLHHIERLAEQHPDWKAVEIVTDFGPGEMRTVSWGYGELNRAANRVAHFIQRRCSRGRTVAMSLERDLTSFAVILGILKAGNVYVPIEASLPAERQLFILQDSDAAMFFTSNAAFDLGPLQDRLSLVAVGSSFLESLETESVFNPVQEDGPSLDAYLLYTSGSTGTPKGVRVSGSNLASFMDGHSHFICTEAPATRRLGGSGKYLCLASRAFDVHIGEMFLAWRHGMCAVTGERLGLLDNLSKTLKELHVTHASFVPSLLDQTGLSPDDAPDLVYLGVGGEKMTPQTQQVWASSERVALVNAYGPTEVTIGCCSARMRPGSDPRSIGTPIGDTCAHVLVLGTDVYAKKGMPGELAFSGRLVANGYHNRPDAAGFCLLDGRPVYRTGDIVRMEPDGSILFLGRKDDQVKVRGQRLELGEVSHFVRSASTRPVDVATLLLRHPEMPRQSLVTFVAEAGQTSHREASFLQDRFAETQQVFRRACQDSLPAYMVPDFILPISVMPLTETSAKTDNKLLASIFGSIPLPRLFGNSGPETNGVKAPSRPLDAREKQVVAVIASVVPQHSDAIITPETSVFQLGVDSIAAVSISFKLRRLGFDASVAQILRNQSIEQLVSSISNVPVSAKDQETAMKAADGDLKALEDTVRAEFEEQSKPIAQAVESIWPCLPLQETLVAHSLSQGPEADGQYISHIIFELAQGNPADRVRRAWEIVGQKVPILRTCFHCRDKDIVQVVLKASEYSLPWTTVSGQSSELEKTLRAMQKSLSDDIVMNLHRAPPMRLTLACAETRPGDVQPSLLMLSIHHGLYDMKSLELIVADVESAYAHGHLSERPSVAPLMRHIAMQSQHEARKYWEAVFTGWERSQSAPPQGSGPTGPRLARRVLKTRLGAIESLCVKSSLTLAGLMQALFAYVLAQASTRNDITFGVVLSGRSIDVEGIQDIRAPCITTIPQRLCLPDGAASLTDVVAAMQKQLFDAMDHQYTSLRSIASWLGVSGPLFSSIFSFIKTPAPTENPNSPEKALKYFQGHMPLDYAFVVECEANIGQDSVTLTAQSTLFEDLATMLESIEVLASALLRGQHISISASGNRRVERPVQPTDEKQAWSPLEETIRDAIISYCGIDSSQITRTTPFIRFGIDSITTIRFAKLLRERGIQVSGADVVRNPSIKHLTQHIESMGATEISIRPLANGNTGESEWKLDALVDVVPPNVLHGIDLVYPLTPLQAGMVTATVSLNSQLYSHHHVLSLPQDTDVVKLKSAWNALLSHHDVLRTLFLAPRHKLAAWAGAVLRQPVLRWEETEAESVDTCLPDVVAKANFSDASSFANPPVRATVIKSPTQLVLIASLHHATYDMVSIGFIFHDLWRLYNDATPPKRRPFHEAAMAIWKEAQQSLDFWTSHLAGYRSVRVPLTDNEEARSTLGKASVRIVDDVSQVEEWCISAGVTVQSLVFLALAKAVCSLAGARDVVLGQVLAGRVVIDEADEIAGPMINTLPFRLCLSDSTASNLTSLRGLQETHNRSLDHQHGSLVNIQKVWRGQNSAADELFDTLFVFHKAGEKRWDDETPWRPYEPEGAEDAQLPSQYRLNVEAEQRADDSLVLSASSKMEQSRLESLLDLVGQCLRDVVAFPERLAVAFPETLATLPLSLMASPAAEIGQVFQQEAIDRFMAPLTAILCQLTGSPAIGVTPQSSIYSIGIDSITAIRAASICRTQGMNLSTADLIRNTRLGRLCEVILAKCAAASEPSNGHVNGAVPLVTQAEVDQALLRLGRRREEVEEVLPVLPGQEYFLGLWLLSGKTKYETTWALRAGQKLDASRLQRAWSMLRQRVSTLRTCFVSVAPDKALQVVLATDEASPCLADLDVDHGDPGTTLEETVRDGVRRAYHSPSSLLQPPARISLIQGTDKEGDAVLLTLHHATYDGWSIGLLIAELSALYKHADWVVTPLPSFSRFVRETSESVQTAEAEDFWRKALGSRQPTIVGQGAGLVPCKAGDASVSVVKRARHFIMLECPGIDVGSLEAAARRAGVAPQTIIAAAFASTLCTATTSRSAVFGYFGAGRSAAFEGIERLAGPTVNMLPLAVPEELVPPATSVGSVVAERLVGLQEVLSERTLYEQSRLGDVLRWAGHETSLSLFNAHLNILWNDEVLVASPDAKAALFRPWTLGLPSEFAPSKPIHQSSAVDGLDVGYLPSRELYVDIGPAAGGESSIRIGAGCDAETMRKEELERLMRLFCDEMKRLVGAV